MDEKEVKQFEDLINKKNKYDSVANEIYEYVGTKKNFVEFYNCVSRFRLVIKEKDIVNLESIKKIPLVKGVKWNGLELQIIIGGEVYKVTEAFTKLMDQEKSQQDKFEIKVYNKTFKEKILGLISGIIMPSLPVIMAAGILKAIQALLVTTTALYGVVGNESLITNDNQVVFEQLFALTSFKAFLTIFVYIIAEAGLSFMGIYFCYNTVKYFGGNPVMGVFVAIGVMSPFLIGKQWEIWNWNWIININGEDLALGIYLKGYGGSILPQIMAGAIFVYFDKLNEKWVPKTIDIIIRPAFSFGITILLTLGIVGPILNTFEQLLTAALSKAGNTWYGAGIFTALWQPLVLTGMHYAILMPIMINQNVNGENMLLVGTCIAVVGQAGAATAVAFRTKSAKTSQVAIGSMPAAFFGVTEPAIFGVNLPKFKPFIFGSLAAGFGAILATWLKVGSVGGNASMGLLFIITFVGDYSWGGHSAGLNTFYGILSIILGAGLGFLIVFFTYRDRLEEGKNIKKITNKLKRIYLILTGQKLEEQKIHPIVMFVTKEKKETFKKVEKSLSSVEKIDVKIDNLKTKEDKIKDEMVFKIKKALNSNRVKKAHEYKDKVEKIDFSKKILLLNKKKDEIINERNDLLDKLEFLQKDFLKIVFDQLQLISKEKNCSELIGLEKDYFNAIHSVDILYGLNKKEELIFTRKKIKNLKEN